MTVKISLNKIKPKKPVNDLSDEQIARQWEVCRDV